MRDATLTLTLHPDPSPSPSSSPSPSPSPAPHQVGPSGDIFGKVTSADLAQHIKEKAGLPT